MPPERDGVRSAMRGGAMAASIEALSLLFADILGVPALLHAHSSTEVALIYTFGIACGGLGSRISAMLRERLSERLPEYG